MPRENGQIRHSNAARTAWNAGSHPHRASALHPVQETAIIAVSSGSSGESRFKAVAERIDARQFNASYPRTFPRFVQHSIRRYCSQSGLDICNGNRIDDAKRCANMDCRVRLMCDRVELRKGAKIETVVVR